jgi:hypothetical protein
MRGDMALWMLTKFAMLFFIILLAATLVGFEERERKGICESFSQTISDTISSRLNQVINSPSEDEKRVYSFQAALAQGQSELQRYQVNLSFYLDSDDPILSVQTLAFGEHECGAGSHIGIPKDLEVYAMRGDNEERITGEATLTADPSAVENRSYYLVFIRCAQKLKSEGAPPRKFLFVQDCRESDARRCLDFSKPPLDKLGSTSEIGCGFANT